MRKDGHALGLLGETLTRLFLHGCGYECLAERWRCREGEIDLVMRRRDLVVFVEVKARRGDRAGRPEEWVTGRKRARLRRAARRFLASGAAPRASGFRFDVVAVDFRGEGRGCRLRHLVGVG
jgi:putative endonuclease